MRNLFLLLFLSCSIGLLAQTRLIKNPPFSAWNSSTIEIDSIVLSDRSTVFHLSAYSSPQHWIKISAETYIKANDNKWVVESANGIELDKEVFPDQSGRRIFSLTFPAIPKELKKIDFIEGDCETCFKTWGIELQSTTLTNRIQVPQAIRTLAALKEDGKPLAAPILKAGDATLKGYLLGYVPEMESKVAVYLNNPLSDEQEEYTATVATDGSFEVKVPMISTEQVLLRISAPRYNNYVLLTPTKETSVYFDMQQMGMNDARSRIDKAEKGQSIYFGGSNSHINNQLEELNYFAYQNQFLDHGTILSTIAGMSANEFKTYIMAQCSLAVAGVSDKKLSLKTQTFVQGALQNQAMHYLFMGEYFLEDAYRQKNNLDRDAAMPDYNYPIFEKEYYSFLKEYGVNNPQSIYNNNYPSTIRSCASLKTGFYSYVSISSSNEYIDELIKNEKLKGEELLYAQSIKEYDDRNWSAKKVGEFNQHNKAMYEKLLATGKLTGRNLLVAKHVIQLCNSGENKVKSISEFGYELTSRINREKLFGEEDFTLDIFTYSEDIGKPEKEASPEMLKVAETFWPKYKDAVQELQDARSAKERRKPLVEVLGTDKGFVFDMIDASNYNSKLKDYKPLSKGDLQALSAMTNPFYYPYFLKKNTELLALLKSREGKKLENVYDTPQVEDDKVLHEIVKQYEGKVILIDFWATWCGPCRSAMKDFEPTKKTFEGKDVVFIYLTDESSPMALWENMIPTIDGKHFRLKDSQFSYLKKKYGATGIPAYLILNKKGEQVYFQVGFEGADRVGKILNDELAK